MVALDVMAVANVEEKRLWYVFEKTITTAIKIHCGSNEILTYYDIGN